MPAPTHSPPRRTIRWRLPLAALPLSLGIALSGCGPSDARVAALEQRVAAAEARAEAADQRARKAEQLAMQPAAAPQPLSDTNSIDGQTSPDLEVNNPASADLNPDDPGAENDGIAPMG